MKTLEKFQHKKGNKLIFRQQSSDIPSLGSVVLLEKEKQDHSNAKNKKYSEIGKIIDVFGPVKEPWVVVNLFRDKEINYNDFSFYWKKEEKFIRGSSKDKKFIKKKSKRFEKKK